MIIEPMVPPSLTIRRRKRPSAWNLFATTGIEIITFGDIPEAMPIVRHRRVLRKLNRRWP